MGRRPYRGQFLLIVLVTVVPLFVGGFGLAFLEQRFISTTGEAVAVVAADIADSIDLLLLERYGDIQVLADIVPSKAKREDGDAGLFTMFKRAYPLYLWVGVANAEGRIVDASDPSTVNMEMRGEGWFQEAKRTGSIYVGDVRRDLLTGGNDAISFSKPLFARSVHGQPGAFLGVVTTRIGIPALEEITTRTIQTFEEGRKVWRTVEYQVLRNDGHAFIDSDLSHKGDVNLKQMGLPSAELGVAGQSGYIEEDHRRRHVPVLTGYARTKGHGEFAGLGWTVLIRVDRSEVVDPIHGLLWKVGLTGGLVVLPLVAMLLWTARRVQREWGHAQQEKEQALAHEQHLQAIVTTIPECVLLVSREGVVRDANHAACVLFDVRDRTELIGKPISPFIYREDRPAFQVMHQSVWNGEPGVLQCQVSPLPNVQRWVEVTASCLRDGRGAVQEALYVLRDITEHKRAEWRILGQHEVTLVLAESDSLCEAAPGLLRAIGTGLDWSVGALWEMDPKVGALRCTETWQCTSETLSDFLDKSREVSLAPGVGLPGRVWTSGEVLWIADVRDDVNFPRSALAVRNSLCAAVAFPILLDGEILGVMEFFSSTVRHSDNGTLSAMGAFGIQIGAFVRRKRTQEQEAGFGHILDDMLNEIYLFDAGTLCFLHVNRGAQANLGYSADELLRLTPLDLMPEFTSQSFATLIQFLHRGERQSLQFNTVHRRKDASTYPIRVHLQCSLFHGRPTFVAIVLDITEQCRAQQRRATQYAVTRALAGALTVEQAMLGVMQVICGSLNWDLGILWKVDCQREVLQFSHLWRKSQNLFPNIVSASQRATFASEVELPGRVWATGEVWWISDISTETTFRRHAAAEQDGLCGSYAFPIRLRGSVYGVLEFFSRESQPQESDLFPMLAEVGSQIGLFIERIEAESALRENEARTRQMIDTALDAVITMNAEGLIVEWNRQAEVLFGWSRQEAVGRNLATTIIPEAYRAAHEEGLKQYVEMGQDAVLNKLLEVTAVHRDGRVFPVEVAIAPLRLEGGLTFSAFLRDISARKQAEKSLTAYAQELEKTNQDLDIALAQAKAATEAKSTFLATMSHEIRTPMNGVIGMTGLLLETGLTQEQQGYAETVRTSGEHLLTIINDILDFSKIEAGKLTLEIIDFDLRHAMEECLDLFSEQASAKGINLVCLFHAEVPTALRGDPGRIRQIVTNLIGNAIKFTKQGDVVLHVSLVEERGEQVQVRFEVADSGIGIAPDTCANLFQSFSQADASMARKYGGTGLGLAISRRLVEMMEGTIGVESKPGEGSRFWFAVSLEQQPMAHRAPQVERTDLRGLHALVVNDKEINRRVLELYLKKWELQGTFAESGEFALQLLRKSVARGKPYDVVILDLDMVAMDGLHLAQAINKDRILKGTHTVLLSATGRRGDAKAAVAAGVAGYLTKPVREAHLYDCLTAVTGRPRRQQGADGERSAAPLGHGLVTRHSLAEAKRKTGIRLLLAEDNIINQKVAVHMLEKMGYHVDVVANGAEAIEATNRIAYSAVLMDCQMPEMDGFDATSVIRQREAALAKSDEPINGQQPTQHVPIIAMTANSMKGDRERCLEAGMDEYISKPVKSQDLASILTRLLKNIEPAPQQAAHPSLARKMAS
ncbi:MAG: PAS domain S-box protein [Nitrospirae bacterium]|nr:PAS domain S-box protein [Nitrospirota bacterium]